MTPTPTGNPSTLLTPTPTGNPSTLYAHALALVTATVGQIVAFVPTWRPEAQPIIAGGSILLAGLMIVGQSIRNAGAGKTDAVYARQAATAVAGALAHVDFNGLVRGELARIVGGAPVATGPAAQAAPPAAAADSPPAPAVPIPPAPPAA